MNIAAPTSPGIDAFHRERSKCIDAFSTLEATIIALLSSAGHPCKGEQFGQKLALLKKMKPNPRLSKARHAKLQVLLGTCEAIAEIRNDLVHSTLQLAVIGEANRACFINKRYCQSGSQTARLFSLEGLRELTGEIERLAEELQNPDQTNPASSPPPPSPGAAGGP